MKNHTTLNLFFLTLLILFGSISINSQSMFQDGDVWYMKNGYDYSGNESIVYRVGHDTIHNGRSYKTIEYTKDTSSHIWLRYEYIYREDSGKVYSVWNDNELLFFDLNWELGDTIELEFAFCGGEVNWQISDTLANGDSTSIMQLWLHSTNNFIIRKVGLLYDMFNPWAICCADCKHDVLSCFFRNEELIYKFWNKNSISCYNPPKSTSNSSITEDIKIRISPNIIERDESTIITNPKGLTGELYVINTIGRTVQTVKLKGEVKQELTFRENGLMYILVRGAKQSKLIGKIFVH